MCTGLINTGPRQIAAGNVGGSEAVDFLLKGLL